MVTQLLTFSSLYPNESQPGLGLFVEARLRQLLATAEYSSRVIAPVPWFPFSTKAFGKYAQLASVPKFEERHGIPVWHPRYFHLPAVGMNSSPSRIDLAVSRLVRRWPSSDFNPQLIDAHYFYPDGVAAARLARKRDLPLMITARGSDINLISQYAKPLNAMREAAAYASAIVAVSAALAEKMVELGFNEQKIQVLRNGVDLDFFRPLARDDIRQQMNLSGQVLLSVGNLVELKGFDLVIDALTELPDSTLLIAGSGPLENQLIEQVANRGLQQRVRLLGQVNQQKLRDLYNAADALVLASSREGLANVLLESIACGTEVIATAVGGNPEVVSDTQAGQLLPERSAKAIAEAAKMVRGSAESRNKTREFSQRFGWQDTCHKLDTLIQSIL